MIDVQWDTKTWGVVDRIEASMAHWNDVLYERMPAFFAKEAMEHIKPMMHVRPWHTGALESSLHAIVDHTASGFEIQFESLFYGMYMDTGNDGPWFNGPDGEMFATTYGYKTFPVKDGASGKIVPMAKIHTMGHTTPGAPTHFSEKTLDWMANSSVASDLLTSSMLQFLKGVSI